MTTQRTGWHNHPLILGALAVLVIVGLLLPPISILERLGITCAGTSLDANTPAMTTPDGLTVALSDTAQPFTLRVQSIDQAKFVAGESGAD